MLRKYRLAIKKRVDSLILHLLGKGKAIAGAACMKRLHSEVS